MSVAWDSFASPSQIGEIHRQGYERMFLSNEHTDDLVRWHTGKYPRDLTRDEADQLIQRWEAGHTPMIPEHLEPTIRFGFDRPYSSEEK